MTRLQSCAACGCGLVMGGVAVASVALNIWNIVLTANALKSSHNECHGGLVQAFLIGSLVSSALTLLSCGITIPVPSLVFAILGTAWRHQSSLSACNAFNHDAIHKSLAVLWYTVASGFLIFFTLFCAPFGISLGMLIQDQDNYYP